MSESIVLLSEALENLKLQSLVSEEAAEQLLDQAVRGEIDLKSISSMPTCESMQSSILQLISTQSNSQSSLIAQAKEVILKSPSELSGLMKNCSKVLRNSIKQAQEILLKATLFLRSDESVLQQLISELFNQLFGLNTIDIANISLTDQSVETISFKDDNSIKRESKTIENINNELSALENGHLALIKPEGLLDLPQLAVLQTIFDLALHNATQGMLVLKKVSSDRKRVLVVAFRLPQESDHAFIRQIHSDATTTTLKHFEALFNDTVHPLVASLASPFDPLYHKNTVKEMKKLIAVFSNLSVHLLVGELNRLAQSVFQTATKGVGQQGSKKQIQLSSDFRIEYSEAPKCHSNSITLFQQVNHDLLHKAPEGKYIVKSFKLKTQRISFGLGEQSFARQRSDEIVLDFDREGVLKFISNHLSESHQQQFGLAFKNGIASTLSFQEIFSENRSMLTQIKAYLERTDLERQQIQSTSEWAIEISQVDASFDFDGSTSRSFSLLYTRSPEGHSQPQLVKQQSSQVGERKISKIKKALNSLAFINRTSKGAMAKQMVMNNADIKNSYVREYLPDRDLKKIEASETKNSDQSRRPTQNEIFLEDNQSSSSKRNNGTKEVKSISAPKPSDFFVDEVKDAGITSFELNIFNESENEKTRLVWNVFSKCGYFDSYSIPMEQFCKFLHTIRHKYNKHGNPFHNFDHGISVMHGCYMIAYHTSAKQIINPLNKFALVLSGICHDISHRARTNVFEVNTLSKLAIRYHDKSVLEQHHIAVTFKVIRQKETNILVNFPLDQLQELRKLVISNILSTDIKHHFDLLSEFEMKLSPRALKGINCSDSTLSSLSPADFAHEQNLITNMIIHASDFSGTAQTFAISRQWSMLVNQEFSIQYKEEGEKGVPQTPYLKDLDKMDILARNEIGFVKAIVKPLWEILSRFLGDDLSKSTNHLANNIKEWEDIAKKAAERTLQRTESLEDIPEAKEDSKESS